MNLNKALGRVATTFVAATMLAAFSAVPASAEAQSVSLKKVINLAGITEIVKVPNTSFTFTVDEGTAATENGVVINSGVEGGVYFDGNKNTVTFAPSESNFSKETQLTVDTSKFTAPGVYRYDVKETTGTYDGMSYDETTHHLDVYVTNKADGGFDFAYVFDGKGYGQGEGKTDGSIINTYTTHKVTVAKTVEGNQGDKSKKFDFSVKVTGADGEMYTLKVDGGTSYTLTSGAPQQVSLTDGQEFVIYGLSENDTYTVEETSYAAEGYTTTVDKAYVEGNTREDSETGASVSVNVGTDDDSVMFYNYKNATAPTGIVMNVAPYVLLVVVAAAGCFVFLRKRRED